MDFKANLFHRIEVEACGLVKDEVVRTVTGSGVWDEELIAHTIRQAQRELGRGNVTVWIAAYADYNGKRIEIKGYPISIHFEYGEYKFPDGNQQATLCFSNIESLMRWFRIKQYGGRILDIAAEAAKDWLGDEIQKMEVKSHALYAD